MNKDVTETGRRKSGQITEAHRWLILTESTWDEEKGAWIHSCGEIVMVFTDYRPIWDGPLPCSGRGEVRREVVPYCSKCEEKPLSAGPIDLRKVLWGNIGL